MWKRKSQSLPQCSRGLSRAVGVTPKQGLVNQSPELGIKAACYNLLVSLFERPHQSNVSAETQTEGVWSGTSEIADFMHGWKVRLPQE